MDINNDVFALVKNQNIDIKDFMKDYLDFDFDKNNKTVCPFHADSIEKPNFSYEPKKNIVKCFVCEATGDLINFIVQYKQFDKYEYPKVEAAKFILDTLGVQYLRTSSTPIDPEVQKKIDEENKKKEEERKKRNDDKQALIIKDQKIALTKMKKLVPDYTDSFIEKLSDEEFTNSLKESFITFKNIDGWGFSGIFTDWMDFYLGYDESIHDSLVILNRTEKQCFNIKHKYKYNYDKVKKQHLATRKDGKWISYYNATAHVFPLDYFYSCDKKEPVIICEGEKDALNLLSYGIPVLTLGGVSTSWENHKELLKDRIVYIWFDNDNAGYEAAIKRYQEISKVSSEVYVTLFYDINNALPKNYDITDFLFDKKFESKDDIFHAIAYSSYKLTTAKIEDIEEYTNLDLEKYYFNQPIKSFEDIKRMWSEKNVHQEPKYITPVKGEKDIKGLGDFFDKFKKTKEDKNFENAKKEILQEVLPKFAKEAEKDIDDLILMFNQMFYNYSTLHKNYSQTHLSDMVSAFENMAKRTDNTFGKYNSKLCIWTGSHFQMLEDEDDIERFLLKVWMPLSWVDKKKRSAANVNKMLEDIYMGAVSLNAIKKSQKNKRVLNLKNGTLFITNKGRIDFKNIHSKKDAATNILDFDYDLNATSPKWDKFLDRVLPNKQDQETLMQYIGYCFLPSHDYESFILLYGESGSNGKSVIIDVVRSFFGKENVSNLQLQDFEGHQLHSLNNKIINMGSEIDTKGLVKGQLQKLKNIVSSEDSLEINPKMRDPYEMDSKAKPKLWFAVNDKPKSGMDAAVFRRTLFLNFQSEIKDDEKIRGLSKRFDDEKSGIFNKALAALTILIKNGKFTKSENMINDLEDYKDEVSPLRRYVKDCIEIDQENMIPKRFLYEHYKEYAKEKGHHALAEQNFWTKLDKEIGKKLESKQLRHKIEDIGDRPRFVLGIFCNETDIISFPFAKSDIKTTAINFNIKTKLVNIKEENISI